MDSKTIGAKIKMLRFEKEQMTQAEFAAALKVSRTIVAEWEVGIRTPSLRSLKKIASLCGCRLSDLTAYL